MLPDLPLAFDGLRTVVLGDLHVCPSFPAENLAPALALAKAAKPDLLLLVGDYICDREGDYNADMAACVKALEPLARSARLGAFAVFGNHDFPAPPLDPPSALWESAGITPLLDTVVPLTSE
ncbi:metallophosphoesterase, partial [Armatimonas sp.]|uniref:metallophosphoesterase n=1 Tax=Armatimonas sp. TaxID=1872638 RepID=UPI00286A251B